MELDKLEGELDDDQDELECCYTGRREDDRV